MQEQAEAFGFNQQLPPGPLAARRSRASRPSIDQAELGQSGIGQFEVSATPLQMAMVAAGIANDGVVMKPYLVDEVHSADLDVLSKTDPEELSRAVSASTASELTEMMVDTVVDGTADAGDHPGHRRRRQDRHRPERRGRRAAVRLVHLVRAGRQPPGRGRGAWSRRPTSPAARSPAAARRPDRQGSHGGGDPVTESRRIGHGGSEQFADDAGRYRLDSRIATGGMGEVWRGTDTVLGREVAVKLLKTEYADDPTFRARFETEAQHAAALHHPNVAAVFDFGEAAADRRRRGDRPYLVMELVDGQPLSALLRRTSARWTPTPPATCSPRPPTRSAPRTPPASCTAT